MSSGLFYFYHDNFKLEEKYENECGPKSIYTGKNKLLDRIALSLKRIKTFHWGSAD